MQGTFELIETTLERPDGPPLFYRKRLAAKETARMVIVHGLGEHSGRYIALSEQLAQLGLSLWILDLRGHGKSGGKRGHIGSFEEYVQDVRQILDRVQADKPADGPCFLLGHSMGGLVAALFALGYPAQIDGLVLSSPALDVAAPLPVIKKSAAMLLARFLPRLGIKNELDPQNISRNPVTVRQYIEDPLVHDRVSTRWFVQFLKAAEKARTRAADIDTPILVQAAGTDRLVSTDAVETFFGCLTTPDRTLRIYRDLYHEIYNETEPDRQMVISELTKWLADRIG